MPRGHRFTLGQHLRHEGIRAARRTARPVIFLEKFGHIGHSTPDYPVAAAVVAPLGRGFTTTTDAATGVA